MDEAGIPLVIRVGEAVDVFQKLVDTYDIKRIFAHQETGIKWVGDRNKTVKQYLDSRQVEFIEYQQNGVIRNIKSRDGWASAWMQHMQKPLMTIPKLTGLSIDSDDIPEADTLGLLDDHCTGRQTGGREKGLQYLKSFLSERGEGYAKEMSSPVTAFESCSRLSPYIAMGCLSIREIHQAVYKANYVLIQHA